MGKTAIGSKGWGTFTNGDLQGHHKPPGEGKVHKSLYPAAGKVMVTQEILESQLNSRIVQNKQRKRIFSEGDLQKRREKGFSTRKRMVPYIQALVKYTEQGGRGTFYIFFNWGIAQEEKVSRHI